MAGEIKNADKLYQALITIPELYFAPTYAETYYDIETKTIFEQQADPSAFFTAKPSKIELTNLVNKFFDEVRVNRYQFAEYTTYIKNLYYAFKTIFKQEIHTIGDQEYIFRKGIIVFYDYHPEANPEPLQSFEKLQEKALREIESYSVFQQDLITEILDYLNKKAGYVLSYQDTPVKDSTDSRLFIAEGPGVIRSYFSVLKQETSEGRPILSENDFEYFLSLNFQGFSTVTQNRSLTFNLIGVTHMQYLVYRFYKKYSDNNINPRKKWLELLKNTFPSKYPKSVKEIGTNFKKDKNNFTINRFEDLGLTLPE